MEIKVGDIYFLRGPWTEALFIVEILEVLVHSRTKILYSTNNNYYKAGRSTTLSESFLGLGTKITKKELETYRLLYFD